MNIWQIVERLIAIVMKGEAGIEREFLSLLDQLAWKISEMTPKDYPVGAEVPEGDSFAIRKAAAQCFPDWGLYNVAGNITQELATCEIHLADAIDDVADIISDLKTAWWSYQHESEDVASWHLLFSFYNHWRAHMRSLQLYVHWLENSQGKYLVM